MCKNITVNINFDSKKFSKEVKDVIINTCIDIEKDETDISRIAKDIAEKLRESMVIESER